MFRHNVSEGGMWGVHGVSVECTGWYFPESGGCCTWTRWWFTGVCTLYRSGIKRKHRLLHWVIIHNYTLMCRGWMREVLLPWNWTQTPCAGGGGAKSYFPETTLNTLYRGWRCEVLLPWNYINTLYRGSMHEILLPWTKLDTMCRGWR